MSSDTAAGQFEQSEADLYRVQRNRLNAAFENLRRAPLIVRLAWAFSPGGLCDHVVPFWHPSYILTNEKECPLCGQRT